MRSRRCSNDVRSQDGQHRCDRDVGNTLNALSIYPILIFDEIDTLSEARKPRKLHANQGNLTLLMQSCHFKIKALRGIFIGNLLSSTPNLYSSYCVELYYLHLPVSSKPASSVNQTIPLSCSSTFYAKSLVRLSSDLHLQKSDLTLPRMPTALLITNNGALGITINASKASNRLKQNANEKTSIEALQRFFSSSYSWATRLPSIPTGNHPRSQLRIPTSLSRFISNFSSLISKTLYPQFLPLKTIRYGGFNFINISPPMVLKVIGKNYVFQTFACRAFLGGWIEDYGHSVIHGPRCHPRAEP
ncbi:hypothetical protein MA16_Dca015072 [Dendrobium catenatum]|uniref:Uncharacterized protein n=1 Tax=Dendrobium catenatum TaxID=906689 RepID=A0A2I0VM99_9ASPA|nr:hypothetical protein MA16_Dca015072 [Dendrobium catenatum]